MRGKSPEDTAMDLVIEDGSRVGTIYFLMSEDNVQPADRAAVGRASAPTPASMRAEGVVPEVAARTRAPTATSRGCSGSTCATST